MRKIQWLLVLSLLSSVTFAQTNIFKYKKLPDVTIKDIKGLAFKSSDISNDGKPIIISFWATWCKPCIRELTTMADVYDEWVKETGVKLYAVSVDDARSANLVAPLVNGKGWDYTVLLDPNSDFKRAMNVGPIPHTFLLNGNGEVVWQHTSFAEGDELELIELVRKLNKGEEIK
ncbi:MAG: TlpA disulfide reductase family protein [Bacteroidales bacterium]|nr:TlpA family protein disulfide reductase [Bacteroidales bacterium]MDD4604277.1 TlpA disulfide reductase family protein [Bacteroidales bacterium]